MNPVNWDINRINAGFWDSHMVLAMLQWLKEQNIYEKKSINDGIKKLLTKTYMSESYEAFTGEIAPPCEIFFFNQIYPALIKASTRAKEQFVALEERLGDFLTCMNATSQERASTGNLIERKTIKEWSDIWKSKNKDSETSIDFSDQSLEMLLRYCYLFFAFGEYGYAKRWCSFYLEHPCEVTVEGFDRIDLKLKCIWGLLASAILTLPSPEENQSLADSKDSDYLFIPKYILLLDDLLEISKMPRNQIILNRLWLVSWTMWPLLRYYFPKTLAASNGNSRGVFSVEWTRLIEWLFTDNVLTLVSTLCPQLFRYVSLIAILTRQRQDHFRAVVDIISRFNPQSEDILTTLVDALLVKYNFEEAQAKLAVCKEAAAADFLLAPLKNSIEEHARLLIFQTYCRVQKAIDIDMIAKKLHMTSETAERWIVNLIRHARLEAKIDSERNCVEIATPATSLYQQVLDKTRNILVRSSVLIENIERPVGTGLPSHNTSRNEKPPRGILTQRDIGKKLISLRQ